MEDNFNGCEGLLDSPDLNTFTVKKEIAGYPLQTYNAVDAQGPEVNER